MSTRQPVSGKWIHRKWRNYRMDFFHFVDFYELSTIHLWARQSVINLLKMVKSGPPKYSTFLGSPKEAKKQNMKLILFFTIYLLLCCEPLLALLLAAVIWLANCWFKTLFLCNLSCNSAILLSMLAISICLWHNTSRCSLNLADCCSFNLLRYYKQKKTKQRKHH